VSTIEEAGGSGHAASNSQNTTQAESSERHREAGPRSLGFRRHRANARDPKTNIGLALNFGRNPRSLVFLRIRQCGRAPCGAPESPPDPRGSRAVLRGTVTGFMRGARAGKFDPVANRNGIVIAAAGPLVDHAAAVPHHGGRPGAGYWRHSIKRRHSGCEMTPLTLDSGSVALS